MSRPRTASDILERDFLEIRSRILDLAAALIASIALLIATRWPTIPESTESKRPCKRFGVPTGSGRIDPAALL